MQERHRDIQYKSSWESSDEAEVYQSTANRMQQLVASQVIDWSKWSRGVWTGSCQPQRFDFLHVKLCDSSENLFKPFTRLSYCLK